MPYTVQTLKSDLVGSLHGTTSNQVTNLNGVINRSARQLLLDLDPQETKRIIPFVTPIYNQVFDYAVPVDLKGNKIIDIRPQTVRYLSDVFLQQYNQAFDLLKAWTFQPNFTINFNTGLKTIRIDAPNIIPGVSVNQAASITGNGTWAVGGNASNLTVDSINYITGGGSLSFDLAAGGAGSTGYLECTGMTAVNLLTLLNQGVFFLESYLPTGTVFSNIELRWGSSSSNYWKKSATVTQQNTAFANGWNLIQEPWSSATKVGSPNSASTSYLRVTWTYDGTAQTAVRLNNIVAQLGVIMECEYYSKYMFRDASTGAFQETVTDDGNLINLDTESYNLLFNLVGFFAVQQQQGLDALFYDGNFFGQEYQKSLERYKAMYKSEIQKPQSIYYRQPKPGYGKFFGRSWW